MSNYDTNDLKLNYKDEQFNELKYYYVYKHTNRKNNKCYIGITSLDLRIRWRRNGKAYLRKDKNGKFYHKKFAYAIQLYGWDNFDHEVIEEGFFTKEDIENREIYWITYYDSFNNGYNTTEGGCISLWSQTETGKLAVSKGVQNLWGNKEYYRKNTNPVRCVENCYIFQDAKEVANLLNIGAGGIRACCSGKQKTAGGYHWSLSNWDEYDVFFKENPNYLESFLEEVTIKKEEIRLSKLNKNKDKNINNIKPVLCIDKDIAYKGQVEASIITGIDRSGIGSCCLNKQNECGGYKWKFIEKDEYVKYKQAGRADISIPLIRSSQKVPVICLETNIIYESIAEAYRKTGIRHINECCKGQLKTAGGYHWEVAEINKN